MCETCERYERERAYKALRLNGGNKYPNYNSRLLAASALKPTLYIKRLRFAGHNHNNIQLRAASMRCPEELKREKEMAEKALSLNY